MFDKIVGILGFRRDLRALVDSAAREARYFGSSQVEAEHLLLAIVGGSFGKASQVLKSLGLSRQIVAAAIDREVISALALAGVRADGGHLPRPAMTGRWIPWGRSAGLAAERATQSAPSDPTLRLLLGIFQAEVGVIPRVLNELDITVRDVEKTILKVEQARGEHG